MRYLLFVCLFITAGKLIGQDLDSAKIMGWKEDAKIKAKEARFISDNTGNTFSQNQLFKEVDPLGFDLFNANLSFSDKDQVQKVAFSPLRMLNNWYTDWGISNLRLIIANSNTGITTGLSLGYDGSALESKRVHKIYKNLEREINALPKLRARGPNESLSDYKVYYELSYKKMFDELVESFDLKRLRHVFKIQGGYNAQFFGVLRSKSPSTSFDSLNYHGFKGNNLFLSTSYSSNNGSLNVSVNYNYFNKRKSADSTQTLNRYDGFSFGVSKRIIRLIGNESLQQKDFYKKSRFIPSILLGVAYESSKFLGQDYVFAEDGVSRIYTWTPYIEFAIIPTIQFRFGFPLKNSRFYDSKSKGETLNAVFQFNYKLINLN